MVLMYEGVDPAFVDFSGNMTLKHVLNCLFCNNSDGDLLSPLIGVVCCESRKLDKALFHSFNVKLLTL